MRKVTLSLLLSALLLGFNASPSYADATDPVMTPQDKEELQEELEEAYLVQKVCYSWSFTTEGAGAGAQSHGSNFKTETDTSTDRRCKNYVHLNMVAEYTPEFSESYDSGKFSIKSSFPELDGDNGRSLGVHRDALAGENEDEAIFKAVSKLPRIVAEKELAPYLPLEENTEAAPENDQAKKVGVSDVIRNNIAAICILSIMIIVSLTLSIIIMITPERNKNDDPRGRY